MDNQPAVPPVSLMLLTPTLHLGGAERVMLTLLQHFDRRRFDLSLTTFGGQGELLSQTPPDVARFSLGQERASRCLFPLMALLKQKRPDVLLVNGHHTGAAALLARALSRVPVKVVIRATFFQPPATGAEQWQAGANSLFHQSRWIFPFADAVVAQTETMAGNIRRHCRLRPQKVLALPNPVDVSALRGKADETVNPYFGEGPHLLSVGRLETIKDIPTLLHAAALFQATHGGTLTVVGDGPEKENLQKLAATLPLKVHWTGALANPFPWFAHADLFVMSSRFDTFPGALLEAHAFGIPSVSTDCPDGPRNIIVPGKTGLLSPVGDAAALAGAMTTLLGPQSQFDRDAALAVAARHNAPAATARYEEVLLGVAGV